MSIYHAQVQELERQKMAFQLETYIAKKQEDFAKENTKTMSRKLKGKYWFP